MDSSPGVGPPSVGQPLRLLPFRGWRLSPGRTGDPATARLFARPYRDVSERLDRWRAAGQLLEDPEPAVYLHEYTSGGLTVRGLVGALDISLRAESPRERAVLPHERVHPHQVRELADRMTTWELNPAPILLVHRGPEAVRDLMTRASAGQAAHEFTDRADQRHRLWTIDTAADLAVIDQALAPSRALIADGHHRYAAYLEMQREQPGHGRDRGLAMLVDQSDTPLFLGAIHRVLLGTSLAQLLAVSLLDVHVALVARSTALAALAHDTLVATDGDAWATISLRTSPARAAVEVLHDQLLPALGADGKRVAYHHSVEEALSKLRSGRGVAVLMPAPDFDQVLGVAEAGRVLPEKATSFQPKPSVGVLIRSLRES